MLFGKETGNWKKYESLKKDDYSVNEKYWKKYKGISKELANEIPSEKLYEIIDNKVLDIIIGGYNEIRNGNIDRVTLSESRLHIYKGDNKDNFLE